MKPAHTFLSKFKSLTPPDDAMRRAVAEAVSLVAGVPVKKKDITISRGIAFVKMSSVAKSALRVRRGEVLAYIFRELPKARDSIRDIR
ncbi:MAG: hypothetical protein AAB923_02305 [Patescibacteria group bacterium]